MELKYEFILKKEGFASSIQKSITRHWCKVFVSLLMTWYYSWLSQPSAAVAEPEEPCGWLLLAVTLRGKNLSVLHFYFVLKSFTAHL